MKRRAVLIVLAVVLALMLGQGAWAEGEGGLRNTGDAVRVELVNEGGTYSFATFDEAYALRDSCARIVVEKDIALSKSYAFDKPVTITAASGAKVNVSGKNVRIFLLSNGAALNGLTIVKTDDTAQNIVGLQTNGIVTRCAFDWAGYNWDGSNGRAKSGNTTRAIEVYAGAKDYRITDNTIANLRQPAYINGDQVGEVARNRVTGSRGWVVCGTALAVLTNNTFEDNFLDICVIAAAAGNTVNRYKGIDALSQANNGAYVENQLDKASARNGAYFYDPAGTNANATIQGAFDNVPDKGTLSLGSDWTYTAATPLNVGAKEMTIDTNGHKLAIANADPAIAVPRGGTLTLAGSGTLDYTGAVGIQNGSPHTVVISGVAITKNGSYTAGGADIECVDGRVIIKSIPDAVQLNITMNGAEDVVQMPPAATGQVSVDGSVATANTGSGSNGAVSFYHTVSTALSDNASDSQAAKVTVTAAAVTLSETTTVPANVTLEVPVTTTITVPQNVTLNVNGALKNEGTLTVPTGATLAVSGTLDNKGTGTMQAAGTVTVAGALNNEGALTVPAGATLAVSGELDNKGTGTMQAAGTVTVVGALKNEGALTVPVGATLEVSGALDNKGTGTMQAAGTVTVADNGALKNEGALNVTGTVANNGTMENTGKMDAAGTVTNTGALKNEGTLNVTGTVANEGEIVVSKGTLNISESAHVGVTGNASITVQKGAELDVAKGADVSVATEGIKLDEGAKVKDETDKGVVENAATYAVTVTGSASINETNLTGSHYAKKGETVTLTALSETFGRWEIPAGLKLKTGTASDTTISFEVAGPAHFTARETSKSSFEVPAATLTVSPATLALKPGATEQLSASEEGVTWSTSDGKVATVDANGLVSAVGEGTATITGAANGQSAACTVTVSSDAPDPAGPADPLGADGIDLGIKVLAVQVGKALVLPKMDGYTGTWSVRDGAVAELNKSGKQVKALALGATDLVYKVESTSKAALVVGERVLAAGETYTIKLNVREKAELPVKIVLDKKKLTLTVGETAYAAATVKPEKALDKQAFYLSGNPKVATVDQAGRITAVAAGKCKITAVSANLKRVTVQVTVKASAMKLELSNKKATLKVGETLELAAALNGEAIDAADLSFTSNKPGIAAVENGLVTALKKGKATITVKTAQGIKTTCVITVKK